MALIAMCVYHTEENQKEFCFEQVLKSLKKTVGFKQHRLCLYINGSTYTTDRLISEYEKIIVGVLGDGYTNLGTANALNEIMRLRQPGEPVIKIDDDIVIHNSGWVELMEEAIQRDPKIGIIGLKRRDLIQCEAHPDPHFRSELIQLPHEPGQRWVCIERTADIIGSVTMFNPLLLDKIGYSRQLSKYGFEDNLFCHRSHLAGFYNCFLPVIDIEHIDHGEPNYVAWKNKESGDVFPEYHKLVHAMINGTESIYYNPFEV